MATRRTPEQAKAEFFAILEQDGARLADGAVYPTSATPIELICARGHSCSPRPGNMLAGQGPCRICAGQDPKTAEAALRARVAELGAVFAEGAVYANSETPVALVCARGHVCAPRPDSVLRGKGLCRICVRRDRAAAEADFLATVARLGGRLADGAAYGNTDTRLRVVCAERHITCPMPKLVMKGGGLCRVCSRKDPGAAEAAFLARVAELGGVIVPGARYVNRKTQVELECAKGHRCRVRPASLANGNGLCEKCQVVFDRVYLLAHPATGAVKVGIASGDSRVRKHTGRGYRLVAQWTGQAHEDAAAAERCVLERWRSLGIEPVAAAPRDGRTETAPALHLADTHEHFEQLLGTPSELRDLPELAGLLLTGARDRAA